MQHKFNFISTRPSSVAFVSENYAEISLSTYLYHRTKMRRDEM